MSAATLERVSIDLGGRRVLSDVSLSIEESEFVGLLGPNGSGKTTLMRALLGLIFARAPARFACWASRFGAAIPPSATCRRRAGQSRGYVSAGMISSPVQPTAIAGGYPCLMPKAVATCMGLWRW